jgi:hypothetical protein
MIVFALGLAAPATAQPSERPPESTPATQLSAFVGGAASSYADLLAGGVAGWEVNRWSTIEARGTWFTPDDGASGFSADVGALLNVIPRQRVTPYVGAAFGLHMAMFDSAATPMPPFYRNRIAGHGGLSELTFTDPAFRLTAGAEILKGRHLTVRPEASMLLVWRDGGSDTMAILGIRLGYRFEAKTVR